MILMQQWRPLIKPDVLPPLDELIKMLKKSYEETATPAT
jgi:hypothetical protein